MKPRFAIVTPYYKEKREVLERCIASVRAQSVACDHILVADGFPQTWLDTAGIRHIKLDHAHGDYGNVARGVGGLLAVVDRYDGIGFLDADNWLDADHAAVCSAAGAGVPRPDLVIARRRFVRTDGSEMNIPEDPSHVDSNCYWFQSGAYFLLHYWVTMPVELSGIGDRVFQQLVNTRQISTLTAAKQTVNYYCLWEPYYRVLGETPPPDAKPSIDAAPITAYLSSLDERGRRNMVQLAGVEIMLGNADTFRGVDRNALCPCGSGKRFKHCHGALPA